MVSLVPDLHLGIVILTNKGGNFLTSSLLYRIYDQTRTAEALPFVALYQTNTVTLYRRHRTSQTDFRREVTSAPCGRPRYRRFASVGPPPIRR